MQQIETENAPEPYEIVVKSLDRLAVASIRHLAPSVQEVGYFCETLYGQLYQRLGRLGVTWGNPELTLYHNEEYAEHDIDMEVAAPVAAEVIDTPPREDYLGFHTIAGSDLAAALIYEGPFAGIVGPIQSLLRWVGLHDHASVGALRELHLSGRAHEDTSDAMRIIELQIPIAPIAALQTQAVK